MLTRSLAQALVAALPFALAATGAGAQPYDMSGSEAPLPNVVETFLSTASSTSAHPATFAAFCGEYRIDPAWPSAAALATAIGKLDEAYGERLTQARGRSPFVDDEGLDPNQWKAEELGRTFGRVYLDLSRDGLPLDLPSFLRLIEQKVRPTFTLHSDRPFDAQDIARRGELFRAGLAAVTSQGGAQ